MTAQASWDLNGPARMRPAPGPRDGGADPAADSRKTAELLPDEQLGSVGQACRPFRPFDEHETFAHVAPAEEFQLLGITALLVASKNGSASSGAVI